MPRPATVTAQSSATVDNTSGQEWPTIVACALVWVVTKAALERERNAAGGN
jgi:hypothetical protein